MFFKMAVYRTVNIKILFLEVLTSSEATKDVATFSVRF